MSSDRHEGTFAEVDRAARLRLPFELRAATISWLNKAWREKRWYDDLAVSTQTTHSGDSGSDNGDCPPSTSARRSAMFWLQDRLVV
ncbi:MAG TPA: hypothetical protein VF278_08030, partial [Pirellulales bacterium]